MVVGSACAPHKGNSSGVDNSGVGERERAAQRKRTKLRGRVKARNDLGGFGSPSAGAPYESDTMARSECLTPKNGA